MSKVAVVSDQQAAQLIAESTGIKVNPDGSVQTGSGEVARGRMRDIHFEQRMEVINNRLRYLPVPPASVLNFLPITIVVNSPMQAVRGGVPSVEGKNEFASRTWTKLEIEPYHAGDRGREPHEFLPHQVAQAFQNEFPQGGVIWMQGTVEDIVNSEEGKKRIAKAKTDAVSYMRRQLEQGDRLWNAPGGNSRPNITLLMRRCAQRLFDLGIVKRLPEWVNPEIDLEDVPTIVCVCGKTPETNQTVRCSCGYILNVAEAYKRNIVDEESVELERLTRKEVEELGVSEYVAETRDEKQARVKAGVPKPPSKVQERMMDAADALEQRKRK
jgi:hypothetical protein